MKSIILQLAKEARNHRNAWKKTQKALDELQTEIDKTADNEIEQEKLSGYWDETPSKEDQSLRFGY